MNKKSVIQNSRVFLRPEIKVSSPVLEKIFRGTVGATLKEKKDYGKKDIYVECKWN